MMTLVVVEFPSQGPWNKEMANAYRELATDIATEPGLIWKVWTEAPERSVAGGVYLFSTRQSADAYVAKHATRLQAWGIKNIDARTFEVNDELSFITRLRDTMTSPTTPTL